MFPKLQISYLDMEILSLRIDAMVKNKEMPKKMAKEFYDLAKILADHKNAEYEIACLAFHLLGLRIFLPKHEYLYRIARYSSYFRTFD